jgi:hypothetical protein
MAGVIPRAAIGPGGHRTPTRWPGLGIVVNFGDLFNSENRSYRCCCWIYYSQQRMTPPG